jgi:hypothetical protein
MKISRGNHGPPEEKNTGKRSESLLNSDISILISNNGVIHNPARVYATLRHVDNPIEKTGRILFNNQKYIKSSLPGGPDPAG